MIHELQHLYRNHFLQQASHSKLEESWLAEGMSRWAEWKFTQQMPQKDLAALAAAGSTPPLEEDYHRLDVERKSAAYTHAFLFVAYAAWQSGDENGVFQRWWRSPRTGRDNFLNGTAMPSSKTFDEWYNDFSLALALNTRKFAVLPQLSLTAMKSIPALDAFELHPLVWDEKNNKTSMSAHQTLLKDFSGERGRCFSVSTVGKVKLRLIRTVQGQLRVDTFQKGFCVESEAEKARLLMTSGEGTSRTVILRDARNQ